MPHPAPLPAAIDERLRARSAIALEELQATAALRTRIDRKYVVTWDVFVAVLDRLGDEHRALEIEGKRTFRYETIYFDSVTLGAYRAHMQRRRRRYKVRSRRYVDSGLHFFEIKVKGARGETIKHQLPYDADSHGHITEEAMAFLAERLREAYPRLSVPQLAATVHTNYERMTFARGPERLTCDFNLTFSDGDIETPGMARDYVILESKCEGGLGAADRELRRLGVQPVSCSKYCVGVGLLHQDVKVNELRWLLSRYFHWDPTTGLPPQGVLANA